MKIGIDISQVVYETGVSKYTKNLIRELLKLKDGPELVLFSGTLRQKSTIDNYISTLTGNFSHTGTLLSPTILDLLWNRLHIYPIEKIIGKIDVFHSSDWTEPPSKCPKVATIHDLAPILFEDQTNPKIVATHIRKLYWVKNESKAIIVPSVNTKNDLIKLGFSQDKITVIHEAANHKMVDLKFIKRVKLKYKIPGSYALAVGATPRKNTQRIISAFLNAAAGRNMKLVVVGQPLDIDAREQRGVRFTGFIKKDSEMDALYSGASVLIYPSLYEGFGIPILDAFTCRVPVVTSNISSMAEVAGDAAVLVNPLDVKDITSGIKEALAKPKTYITKGERRLKEFSWSKMAQETLGVYSKVYGK